MSDVRSMLHKERALRRIDHPQANYTATGTLECTVCHIPIKSDIEVWTKHLKSTQHAMRQERLRLNSVRPVPEAQSRDISGGRKKRKADDADDDSRKRTRPAANPPGGSFDENIGNNNVSSEYLVEEPLVPPTTSSSPPPPQTILPSHPISHSTSDPQIDEDEWAAFERDVATPPPDPTAPSVFTAEATIIAAPLTAAEVAAQAREQESLQRKERREAEMEGEKEDAERALEEEFDEMEGFEERVRRLREKRDALRRRQIDDVQLGSESREPPGKIEKGSGDLGESNESEGEDDDGDDGWEAWSG